EAAAQVDAARARRLPQVSSTISTTYMTDPPDGVVLQRGSLGSTEAPGTTFPTPVPDQDVVLMPAPESTYYRLGITLEQPLFTWGKLKRGEQAAVLQRSIAAEDRHAASRELRRDTAQAYHGVRFAARMDGLLQDAEDIAGRMLDDQELAYEVGTINLESLLETRAEMQEIRMQRRRAAQALRSAEAGLSMLLHIEVAAEDLVTGYQLHTGNPEEAGLAGEVEQAQYTRAVEISSELQRLRLQLQQAEIGTEVEQLSGMWRPDFSLQVSVEADGQRIPPQANWHDSWNLGVNITLAGRFGMYDGGSQAAAVREAESRQHQLLSGIAELQDGLEYQVRNQREQVANHREEYSLAIVRAELAQERAKNARVSYENELITRTQERGARILQLLAELELERSRYELESSLIELAFLTGRDF
ncbi:MAG: TolC family protein, partial [Spirochaeta sp.]